MNHVSLKNAALFVATASAFADAYKMHDLKYRKQTFLKKEAKNLPPYRDIEFKHKKKRI